MKLKITVLIATMVAGASSMLFGAPQPQIVLLRTYTSTNQIPGWIGVADPSPWVGTNGYLNMVTTAQAIIHEPRTEVVTNYVLGFWEGTNAVELVTVEKVVHIDKPQAPGVKSSP